MDQKKIKSNNLIFQSIMNNKLDTKKHQKQDDILIDLENKKKNDTIETIEKLKNQISELQQIIKDRNKITNEACSIMRKIIEAYKLKNNEQAESLLTQLENLPYKEVHCTKFGAKMHFLSLFAKYEGTNNDKTCLIHQAYYTLIKNPSIVEESTFSSILNTLLKNYLDNTLPFACKKIKDICAEKAYVNSYYEYNVINNIIDFDKLFLYWKYQYKNEDLNSTNAILYYYLGSPVDSFILFDEILDCDDKELTAQQLFYYVLTSKEIDIDFEAISHDAISKLENIINKSPIEYYYLGLIQILSNDLNNGLNNLMHVNSIYAKAILHYFNESNQLIINDNIPPKTIDINKTDLTQFEDFLHTSECYIVCFGKTKNKLWNAFYVSDEDKKNDGTIEKFIISKQAPLIENALIEKYKSSLTNNLFDDQVLKEKKNRLGQLIYESNGKIRRIYQETKDGVDAGYDIENQIGLTIEDYALEAPDAYILIIYYFYLQNTIDYDCVIRLCIYLYRTSNKHYNSKIKDTGTNLSLSIANPLLILLCPYFDLRQISTISKEIFDMVKIKKMQEKQKKTIQIQSESEYSKFKDEYKRHLIIKREELNESEFNNQFKLCEFQHKLIQLDKYLESITKSKVNTPEN